MEQCAVWVTAVLRLRNSSLFLNGWTLESQLLAFLTLLEQVPHAKINLSGKFGAHIRQEGYIFRAL